MVWSELNNLPQWTWFLTMDLRSAALVIATLGIVHPMAFLVMCFVYRSYLTLTISLLTIAWSALSIWLLNGILQREELPYEVWILYTLVLVWVMVVLMLVLLVHCCCRHTGVTCGTSLPPLGILYYMLTFYMAMVVNSHRMQVFPAAT